jgi:hypothetical protein
MQQYIEEHLVSLYEKLTDKQLTEELASEWANKESDYEPGTCPYIVDESPTAQVLHGD